MDPTLDHPPTSPGRDASDTKPLERSTSPARSGRSSSSTASASRAGCSGRGSLTTTDPTGPSSRSMSAGRDATPAAVSSRIPPAEAASPATSPQRGSRSSARGRRASSTAARGASRRTSASSVPRDSSGTRAMPVSTTTVAYSTRSASVSAFVERVLHPAEGDRVQPVGGHDRDDVAQPESGSRPAERTLQLVLAAQQQVQLHPGRASAGGRGDPHHGLDAWPALREVVEEPRDGLDRIRLLGRQHEQRPGDVVDGVPQHGAQAGSLAHDEEDARRRLRVHGEREVVAGGHAASLLRTVLVKGPSP